MIPPLKNINKSLIDIALQSLPNPQQAHMAQISWASDVIAWVGKHVHTSAHVDFQDSCKHNFQGSILQSLLHPETKFQFRFDIHSISKRCPISLEWSGGLKGGFKRIYLRCAIVYIPIWKHDLVNRDFGSTPLNPAHDINMPHKINLYANKMIYFQNKSYLIITTTL